MAKKNNKVLSEKTLKEKYDQFLESKEFEDFIQKRYKTNRDKHWDENYENIYEMFLEYLEKSFSEIRNVFYTIYYDGYRNEKFETFLREFIFRNMLTLHINRCAAHITDEEFQTEFRNYLNLIKE
jgi:hypothetical protein